MTIETSTGVTSQTLAGDLAPINFSFPIWAAANLTVEIRDATTGEVIETAVSGVDYTVTLAAYPSVGGVVTPLDAVMFASGRKAWLIRNVELKQESRLSELVKFPGQATEAGLDRLVAMVQDLRREINSDVRLPPGSDPVTVEVEWLARLAQISGQAAANNAFLVGDGDDWIALVGQAARAALGLGEDDTPRLAALYIGPDTNRYIYAVGDALVLKSGAAGQETYLTLFPDGEIQVNGAVIPNISSSYDWAGRQNFAPTSGRQGGWGNVEHGRISTTHGYAALNAYYNNGDSTYRADATIAGYAMLRWGVSGLALAIATGTYTQDQAITPDFLTLPRVLETVKTVTCGTASDYAGPREAFAAFANIIPVGDGRVVIECANEVHDMGSTEFAPRHTNLERFSFVAAAGVTIGTSEVEGSCVWRWDVTSTGGFRVPRGYTLGGLTAIDIQCGEGRFETPVAGDGVTTVLPYNFEIANGYQLYVIKETAAGVKSVLAETTAYTLNPADFGNPAGGDVTMVAPLANDGATYTVMRAGAPGRIEGACGLMDEGCANINGGTRVRRWWFNIRIRDGSNGNLYGTSHAEADKVAAYDGGDSNLHLFGDGWYEYFESARASTLPDGNTYWGVGIVVESGGRGRGRYTRSWGNHWLAIGGFSKAVHWGEGGDWRNSLGGPIRDGDGVGVYYGAQVDVEDADISGNADYGISEHDFGRVWGTPASNTGNGVGAINQVFAFLASQELAFPHNVAFGGSHNPAAPLDIQCSATTIGFDLRALASSAAAFRFMSSDGATEKGRVALSNGGDLTLNFGVGATERVRFLSGGGFRAGSNGVGDMGASGLAFANAWLTTTLRLGSAIVVDAAAGVSFPSYTAAQIADITHAVNTTNKQIGKTVRDSTNTRLMSANGATAGGTWASAQGATTVTPV